jgi:hypothetical protein
MNLYSLILFSHIVATLGLFAGLGIECVTLRALRRAKPVETRIWITLWPTLLPLTIASAVLLVASASIWRRRLRPLARHGSKYQSHPF